MHTPVHITRVIRHARLSDVAIPVGRVAHLLEDVQANSAAEEDNAPEGEPSLLFDPEAAAAEREAQIEEAFGRGLRTGREEGRRTAEAELRSAVNSMTRLAEQLAAEREEVLREAHELIVHLSCAIAQRIVDVSTLLNTSGVTDVISRTVSHVSQRGSLTIKVHPDDLEVVRGFCTESLARGGSVGNVAFEGDATITRGGCVVDTDSGIVDGRIESQVKVLRDELLGKVRGE